MKNHTTKIVIGSIVFLIGASIFYAQFASKKNNEGLNLEENITGNTSAEVVLTEFSDFQCPACGQAAPFVREIVEQYADQLRFEYKHFPLISIHPNAEPAARAAEAAGAQGKFFEMHDLLFEHQNVWSNSNTPQAYFITYAGDLGLDVDLFKRHMNASLVKDKVQSDMREGRALGINGTPTFFLNGERMQFSNFDEFTAQIESALNPQTEFGNNIEETP